MGASGTYREPGITHRAFFARELASTHTLIDIAVRGEEAYLLVQPSGTELRTVIAVQFGWKGRTFITRYASEYMGPVPKHCPARLLDRLSPVEALWPDGSWQRDAAEWRAACRANLARAAKLAPGARVRFDEPVRFGDGESYSLMVIESLRPLRLRGVFDFDGRECVTEARYRLPRRRLEAEATVVAPGGAA